jgi:DNA repair protein RadA/Sms
MEGSRPVLVEVQALVAPSELEAPRRVANGIDRNRLSLVLAVLARHAKLGLSGADVFVNVAGGVRVEEPGADLAVAMAVASAHRQESLTQAGKPLACFGELGLTGELRYVGHPDRRVAEARKFGLAPVLGPDGGEPIEGLAAHGSLRDALRGALGSRQEQGPKGDLARAA